MPVLTLFAGPNGSGKSSVIKLLDFPGREHLLEADAIAKDIHASDPSRAAISAARQVIRRTHAYLESGQDFAIETTLAGNWTATVIQIARDQGFFRRLVYICVDTSERSIQRVHERVKQGGHDVPDADVRRRYERSLVNVSRVLRTVDHAVFYDNSGAQPKRLLEFQSGVITVKDPDLPAWALRCLNSLAD